MSGGAATGQLVSLVIGMAFVLAVGPLALLYGADSRRWDERGGWPQRKH
mgnify:CR=1 FL=1